MKKISRIIVIVSSLAMITAFFAPTWDISLEAPQYPEGLGMKIWINKITGDLNTINGLNHYIGMKKIEPDSIKELTIMPFILGFLIIAGVAAGILGRRKVYAVWVIVFMLAGIAGGVDFYLWEYDYGHNLDTTAAIIVPGMSYQPPLIGSKVLLNFTAHSYPDTGGIIMIAAGLLGAAVLFYESKVNKRTQRIKNSTTIKQNEKANVKDDIGVHADNSILMQH